MARDDRPVRKWAEDWRLEAACRPFDSELFFPDGAAYRNSDVARAKAVCRKCPVREACLQAAMDGREKTGIWGGMTPQERMSLQRRRRRNRDAAAPQVEPKPDAGFPTRDQIQRGVAAGWLRIDARRFHAPRDAPRG
jgi:WhiB family transcriptional regulator, redox-sensing transcriptional regulator